MYQNDFYPVMFNVGGEIREFSSIEMAESYFMENGFGTVDCEVYCKRLENGEGLDATPQEEEEKDEE